MNENGGARALLNLSAIYIKKHLTNQNALPESYIIFPKMQFDLSDAPNAFFFVHLSILSI